MDYLFAAPAIKTLFGIGDVRAIQALKAVAYKTA